MIAKNAVLLLNIGTPASPDIRGVRKFLTAFLNDKRVIDLPWLFRKILVNCLIVPFRSSHASKRYQRLWTEKGSPLLLHGLSLKQKLQEKLGDEFIVEFASNYLQPGIKEAVSGFYAGNAERLTVFPLLPQYASSTTGSMLERLFKILEKQQTVLPVTTFAQYYDHPLYIEAMAARLSGYDYHSYDHILMSFHGLHLRQLVKSHNGKQCDELHCKEEITEHNLFCYNAGCYATARSLARRLDISHENYTVCFQSRISGNWMTPFTDEVITALAREGKKNLLVVCPSFTSDCLETTIEVGEEYKSLFIGNGGAELTLVESLNDSEAWVDAIAGIISS
jgi:ferrochelatase